MPVEAVLASLPRLEYRGEPFFSEELSLHVYSAAAIFAEKIYIAHSKGAQNTRMTDYYDLHRLCDHQLDSKMLIHSIEHTCSTRRFKHEPGLSFDEDERVCLEAYWGHFLNRDNRDDAPRTISEVISKVSALLDRLYGRKN
ncbi:MAG: nucleotidyl transferase AbiEii/AbiGii toxin family protein [Bdellovibrionales bacterium]|nr:nucleotidyl transferase AbiEii/AbiGii toxin family protein [Bdellovibrionales bacterium]